MTQATPRNEASSCFLSTPFDPRVIKITDKERFLRKIYSKRSLLSLASPDSDVENVFLEKINQFSWKVGSVLHKNCRSSVFKCKITIYSVNNIPKRR
jgi:hypothetical protein